MQEFMLFPIRISTSSVSRTLRLDGRRNSAWSGRKTRTFTDDEKRSPPDEIVKAHRDHFPGSLGAEILTPDDAISDLK